MTANHQQSCRRLSNGETESAKTMLVEDSESDQASTPSKDGTLVIRQVRQGHRSPNNDLSIWLSLLEMSFCFVCVQCALIQSLCSLCSSAHPCLIFWFIILMLLPHILHGQMDKLLNQLLID